MNIRIFTLSIGIIYLIVGVLGFFPALMSAPPANAPVMSTPYGFLFGMFPINTLHNIVHLGIGAWGILAYRDYDDARLYTRSLAVLYAALGVFGLIPALNTLFGLVPLFSHDVWLHLLTAAAAAYFGFVSPVTIGMGQSRPADTRQTR
ncbi:MAG TPA: DUF4383 domain-containing protein [Methylobacter sp.]|jgi:hypothetical protein